MIKLTARQEQILNLIKEAIDNTGFPPTRAEIANELGFKLGQRGRGTPASPGAQGRDRNFPWHLARHPPDRRQPPTCHRDVPAASLMMSLPLVGRVAAGSPILAQEHVETTYSVDPAMFSSKPDFLLKVKRLVDARRRHHGWRPAGRQKSR
jgi:repressor LexA